MSRGSDTSTSSSSTGAAAATLQNAARHMPHCANTPPTAGPSRVATPQATETTLSARGHSRSANSVRMMVNESAESVPANSPCTNRPSSSTAIDGRQRADHGAGGEPEQRGAVGVAHPDPPQQPRAVGAAEQRCDHVQHRAPGEIAQAADVAHHRWQDRGDDEGVERVHDHAAAHHRAAAGVAAAHQLRPTAVHRSSVSAAGTLAMPGGMHSGVALAPLAAGNVCMATRMSAGLCLPGIST